MYTNLYNLSVEICLKKCISEADRGSKTFANHIPSLPSGDCDACIIYNIMKLWSIFTKTCYKVVKYCQSR